MSIDWNRAPEGATHWEPKGKLFCEGWMKKEGNKWSYWVEGRKVWVSQTPACAVSAKREATFEPRPQETWNGQGLPPVGLMVEWKAGLDHDWQRVTVLAYANGDAWLQPEEGDSFIVGNPANFRRIRTLEQIAAEEREKAIEEMCFAEETLTVKQAKALYEAGYRRQEEGK